MSDRLQPLSLRVLLSWILKEEKQGSIFGVQKSLWFKPRKNDPFRMERYGLLMETPLGVAAGPHTQMSQNIILSWLMGARYIELKTIQTLDELEISKPCIDIQDEGYNCEWSQELQLRQSFSEYLNAWIVIHILKKKFGWEEEQDAGFIFNMSAGYDLAGLLKPNVQQFLNLMENCRDELDLRLDSINDLYPGLGDIKIPGCISDNLTLSTMHGCPPGEIEKIGKHLIEKRGYHTTIKLNPTLLGPDRLRRILHDRLGFNKIIVPDDAFDHDLKYSEALKLIKNLQFSARENKVDFSLKLTNTLEVENHKSIFPEKETMMYLSGRPLHAISINLAHKLQTDFAGKLDISFSAGIDAFNFGAVLASNLKPVTVCTDILKPGGYLRLNQYLEEIRLRFKEKKAGSINQYIMNSSPGANDINEAGLRYLKNYAGSVLENKAYKADNQPFDSIKTSRELGAYDCVQAPCVEACATDQDIPEYMYQTARGNFKAAYETILRTNPFPAVTGHVCDHLCQQKCTRANFDNSLLIREIKRFAAEQNIKTGLSPGPSNGLKTAVIGGGPSGLTCAYFLALEGFEVSVYEAKAFNGGMASDAIPAFRLPDSALENDLDLVESAGVKMLFETSVDKKYFESLRKNFDYIYLAAGAQKNKKLEIEGEDLPNIVEPLAFLSNIRRGKIERVGQRVAVIGGGNTAMDAARTSRRMGAEVTILYRRTIAEMPADAEEVVGAMEEGIFIKELLTPEKFIAGQGKEITVVCSEMELGPQDASGRARPVKIENSRIEMIFDTIIPAIGQDLSLDFINYEDLKGDSQTGETSYADVFAGGDTVRGASSIINAVGDGKKAALSIIEKARKQKLKKTENNDLRFNKEFYQKKLALRKFGISTPHLPPEQRLNFDLMSHTLTEKEAMEEAERCLLCDDVCDICVSVCPNLANISFQAEPRKYPLYKVIKTEAGFKTENIGNFNLKQKPQIINIGDFCNECGNCTTFCPTSGEPFRAKPLFHLSRENFETDKNGYYFEDDTLYFKSGDDESSLTLEAGNLLFRSREIEASLDRSTLEVKTASFLNGAEADLSPAADMVLLFENLKDNPLFQALKK